MNNGQFYTSINDTVAFLKKHKLVRDCNLYHIKGASRRVNWADKTKTYIDLYKEIVQNCDYDIFLFDESVIQFNFSQINRKPVIQYAYVQFPHDVPSYDEFLGSYQFDIEEVGELFRNEYEQLLSEANLDVSCVSVRYDYSEREYRSGIHPVSHFHIGHDNSIRIPISKLITPRMFVVFILKQIYYKRWTGLINNSSFCQYAETSKRSCNDVARLFFVAVDKQELYLT